MEFLFSPSLKEAVELHQQGHLVQAEALYRRIIEVEPKNSDAIHLLGVIATQTGHLQSAVELISQAIEINPRVAAYHSNCGSAFNKLKQFEAAVESYDKAIALEPSYADAYFNRGNALVGLDKLQEAINSYVKATNLNPNFVEAYFCIGNTLQALKNFEAAIENYDNAISLKPDFADVYFNRANSLLALNYLDEALVNYKLAIRFKPSFPEAYCNCGVVLELMMRFEEAISSYEKALYLNPKYINAYYNAGNTFQKINQFENAIINYEKAISLNLNYPEAYFNLGNAFKKIKKMQQALSAYSRAVQLNENYADSYYNRGITEQELNDFEASLVSFNKVFSIQPSFEYLLGMSLNARMYICKWQDLSKDIATCESEVALEKPVTTPFIALLLFDKPELHYLSSLILTRSKHPKLPQLVDTSKTTVSGKLRIGYYSADLYYHPVPIWLAGLIENHDKSKFELFAFSFRNDIKDPMRARLEAAFDHFIAVDSLSDLEVAQLSRQLGIDIAIDLNGHTADGRPDIFAARAAPIQVSHIGFPSTMGAEYIDYFICDEYSVPENSKQYFTEKMAYVPCPYTYDRKRQVSRAPLRRADFGLPESSFVFTCQNGCQKIGPEVFGTWMDILKAVPESVLWLLEPHPSAIENLRKEAQVRGVKAERIIFTRRKVVRVEQEEARIARYLASYKLADLFLDTWPYNAGTTAVDALWAGLPVLTKVGRAFVARMAASFLTALEVAELITDTSQQYKELAIELATDTEKLRIIKQKVQANIETTALFDAPGNTRYIESAYLEMYRRHQAKLSPEHLSISRASISVSAASK